MMEQCLKEQNIRENGGRDKMIRRNFLKLFTLFGANATLSANNTIDRIKEKELSSIELNECYLAGLQYYDDVEGGTVSRLSQDALSSFANTIRIDSCPCALG